MFASDRAKFDPGEIYSLALARAPRNVSRSLAGDYGLAVAPTGDQIAFWSGRTGTDGSISRAPTGRACAASAGGLLSAARGSGGALVFSADGRHLLCEDVRLTRGLRRRHAARHGAPRAGVSGNRAAVSRRNARRLRGQRQDDRRPTSPGTCASRCPAINGVWSSRGWLTSAPPINESARQGPAAVVVDPSGTRARPSSTACRSASRPTGAGSCCSAETRSGSRAPAISRALASCSRRGPEACSPSRPTAGSSRRRAVAHRCSYHSRVARTRPGSTSAPAPGRATAALRTPATGGLRERRASGRHGSGLRDRHARPQSARRRAVPVRRSQLQRAALAAGRSQRALPHGHDVRRQRPLRRPASGGATRRLDHDPRDLETPTWSPDGTRIAVSVQNFTCHLGVGLPSHIATVAADGSDARRVTDDGDPQLGSFDRFPSFSPDGSRIAFAHGSFNSASLQITAIRGGVRTPCSPTASRRRDARLVAGRRRGSRYAAGVPSRPSRRRRGAGGDREGSAGRLVRQRRPGLVARRHAHRRRPGRRDLPDHRGRPGSARLAIRAPCAGNPSFSPDGEQIAFDARPAHPLGEQTSIMVARVDGTGVRTLSTVPFRQSMHPSWRPLP